ncbi:hypothetical protein FCV82_06440 [Vibrio breoganii]|uniref:hypothetical protein n=1 Tax=Vibrio breoganii TaxID=553239 RepID=UPI00036211E0|nr:hypothetical protein [Vibrio breoganii]TKF88666.1 hypothetical protein FCV82_06440 [Vibrio breoganii]
MTMIYKDECFELGLPEPKKSEQQVHYVTRVMLEGIRLDTRQARYVGIGNLHSIVSHLNKKKLPFTVSHDLRKCPKTGDVPPYPVDVIWMTDEQRNVYWEMKKAH